MLRSRRIPLISTHIHSCTVVLTSIEDNQCTSDVLFGRAQPENTLLARVTSYVPGVRGTCTYCSRHRREFIADVMAGGREPFFTARRAGRPAYSSAAVPRACHASGFCPLLWTRWPIADKPRQTAVCGRACPRRSLIFPTPLLVNANVLRNRFPLMPRGCRLRCYSRTLMARGESGGARGRSLIPTRREGGFHRHDRADGGESFRRGPQNPFLNVWRSVDTWCEHERREVLPSPAVVRGQNVVDGPPVVPDGNI